MLRLICTAIVLVIANAAHLASAAYPERPVRFIVAAVAGSAPDTNSRAITTELTQQLGQQFIVDNRGGAGGSIGTQLLARAPADGYTIGYGNIASLAIARSAIPKLPYDPERDFQPVALTQHSVNMLAGAASFPVRTVPELIDYAKKNPGKVVYAGASVSSTQFLSGQLFNQMAGTQIKAVSFLGAQAIPAMAMGQVHFTFNGISALEQYVRTGRIRGIAVTGTRRSPAFPELPTVAESLPGYEVVPWGGVIAPAGVPKDVVMRLNAAVNKALASAVLLEKYKVMGIEPAGGTSEQFAAHIRKEIAKWADVVRKAGIKVE
ncbi:MAG: tripartite tricarboxylate transporter substrate-binding protein [Burkholderiales bacterium]